MKKMIVILLFSMGSFGAEADEKQPVLPVKNFGTLELPVRPIRTWVEAQPRDSFCFGIFLQPELFYPGYYFLSFKSMCSVICRVHLIKNAILNGCGY